MASIMSIKGVKNLFNDLESTSAPSGRCAKVSVSLVKPLASEKATLEAHGATQGKRANIAIATGGCGQSPIANRQQAT